jgi:hypothetical protein
MKVLFFKLRKASSEFADDENSVEFRARATTSFREPAKFLFGVMLTIWLPTFACCYVSGELMPLCWMAFNHAIGSVLGFFLYKNPEHLIHGYLPLHRSPKVQADGYGRKAA